MKAIGSILLLGVFLCLSDTVLAQESDVLDGVYVKGHTPTRNVIAYPPLREADVMWTKRIWRVIDLKQKINHVLYYPIEPINNRKSMWDVIKTGVMEGSITAYGQPLFDDEFTQELTKTEVEELLTTHDTLLEEDPETYEYVKKIITEEITGDQVIQYWIKEDWFLDRQRSVMDVRIIGICPLILDYDENNDVRGMKPLFWVYYPQARLVFANAEVYNRQNDAERRTLEDVIWKRQFSSYIRKESNVYDRVIMDYKVGLDALFESDRIKRDMFDVEHDMWHF